MWGSVFQKKSLRVLFRIPVHNTVRHDRPDSTGMVAAERQYTLRRILTSCEGLEPVGFASEDSGGGSNPQTVSSIFEESSDVIAFKCRSVARIENRELIAVESREPAFCCQPNIAIVCL